MATFTWRTLTLAIMTAATLTASAQRRGRIHYRMHKPQPVVVVKQPATTTRTISHLTRTDRLHMAIAYLKENRTLTPGKYSNMTGLTRTAAKAELDAFAASGKNHIAAMYTGKKKVYVLA